MTQEKINEISSAFLNKYTEYTDGIYELDICESNRYNGDYEVLVYKNVPADEDPLRRGYKDIIKIYWVKEHEDGSLLFEEEVLCHTYNVRCSVDADIDKKVHVVYNDSDEISESYIEKKFKKENIQQLREMFARMILSGEIDICTYVSDTDCWEAPLSQVEYLYK